MLPSAIHLLALDTADNAIGIQHDIDGFGAAQISLNSTNQPVVVYLNESESSTVSSMARRRSLFEREYKHPLRRESQEASCGCVWLWT